MHAFGSSQTRAVLPLFFFFCLSGLCPEQHRAGFVFRDEISAQNDLLTPDQTPPPPVSKTACQFYNAWLYLFTQICTVI